MRKLNVTISTWGRFHMFHLARQLERFGMLQRIYSTYPKFKLKNEHGIPPKKIETDPFFQMLQLAMIRLGAMECADWLSTFTVRFHDRWLLQHLTDCDCFIALSGSGVVAGPEMQRRGAKYICDRGSPHIRADIELGIEEFARFGLNRTRDEQLHIVREEQEYKAADCIVVPSHFSASTFIEKGISPDKVRIIPYGANLLRFYPEGRPPENEFRVIFVGGIGLRKGVMDLFEAFSKLRHPKKSLILVGALQPEMKHLLRRADLSHVRFVGSVPNVALREIYSTSHVLVLPSVSEGLAMVMGEALACGCPVIASTNTGANDLFTDGVEGFIVPPRNASILTDRLQQIADAPGLRDQMSEAALLRCQSIGGWNEYGKMYRGVIEDITIDAHHGK
jgi:glycosyltransferase involved in cell wall biosynthesis